MELYQREALEIIRAAGVELSVLSNRALIETWGIYSCEIRNCFWAPCNPQEAARFASWANGKPIIKRELVKAHRAVVTRKENRAAARRGRPPLRFVMGFDGHRIPDNRVHSNDERRPEVQRTPLEALMTIHELIDSTNLWCAEQGIAPTAPGSKREVDEAMVRYCCKYELLDRPGCPNDGRRRGFTGKHAGQLRAIRLLQARSLSFKDINSILHGRPLEQLREIEREELNIHKAMHGQGCIEEVRPRTGSPRWA